MDIKLVVLDLDGTLLDETKRVSDKDRRTLEMLSKMGIKILVASGRFTESTFKILEDNNLLSLSSIMITDGGGTLVVNGEREHYNTIEDATFEEIVEVLREENIQFYVTDGSQIYYESSGPLDLIYFPNDPNSNLVFSKVDDILKIKNILKFVVFIPNESAYQNLRRLTAFKGVKTFRSSPRLAEITSENLDKWFLIEKLIKNWDITPDQVVAMGDSENDTGMLTHAGFGLAPKNALESVKKCADIVSEHSNDQSAVTDLIKKIGINL